MNEIALATREILDQIERNDFDPGAGSIPSLVEIVGEHVQLVRGHGFRLGLRKKAECHQNPGFLGLILLSQGFDFAFGQTSGAMQKPHQIVEFLQRIASGTLKVKPERLGVLYPAPVMIPLAIFVPENGSLLRREIRSHLVAVKALLENHKAEPDVCHFPSVLTFRHFPLLPVLKRWDCYLIALEVPWFGPDAMIPCIPLQK
jgi:hypothetical protein